MKLQFLKYFIVLAEELHFGRAANRLSITQPPLTGAIKSLEEELGACLLLRNSRMVQLTPAGAAFLVEARYIVERVSRARAVVQAVHSGMTGRLDIGVVPSLIYREVIPVINQFNADTPGIEISLHEMSGAEVFEQLLSGQLDAGFTLGATTPQQLRSIPLKDDTFMLCVPKGHSLARMMGVNLRDLAYEKFVMFSRSVGPNSHDNVIAIFNRVGIHPKTVHKTRTWFATMAMVSQGCGLALVPSSLANATLGGVCLIPLEGAPNIAPAMLVWNPVACASTITAPTAPTTATALTMFIDSAAHTLDRISLEPPIASNLGGDCEASRRTH
jgi:DNA-binding transcriptional LysR family regulator